LTINKIKVFDLIIERFKANDSVLLVKIYLNGFEQKPQLIATNTAMEYKLSPSANNNDFVNEYFNIFVTTEIDDIMNTILDIRNEIRYYGSMVSRLIKRKAIRGNFKEVFLDYYDVMTYLPVLKIAVQDIPEMKQNDSVGQIGYAPPNITEIINGDIDDQLIVTDIDTITVALNQYTTEDDIEKKKYVVNTIGVELEDNAFLSKAYEIINKAFGFSTIDLYNFAKQWWEDVDNSMQEPVTYDGGKVNFDEKCEKEKDADDDHDCNVDKAFIQSYKTHYENILTLWADLRIQFKEMKFSRTYTLFSLEITPTFDMQSSSFPSRAIRERTKYREHPYRSTGKVQGGSLDILSTKLGKLSLKVPKNTKATIL